MGHCHQLGRTAETTYLAQHVPANASHFAPGGDPAQAGQFNLALQRAGRLHGMEKPEISPAVLNNPYIKRCLKRVDQQRDAAEQSLLL